MTAIWRAVETQPNRATLPTPVQGAPNCPRPCVPTHGAGFFADLDIMRERAARMELQRFTDEFGLGIE